MGGGVFDRFDVRPLLHDHVRSIRQHGTVRIDLGARSILFGVPLALGAYSFWQDWRLTDPGSLIAACSLLAGILFAAFTQLAALRDRVEKRIEVEDRTGMRSHFRETAAHLMTGSLIAAVDAGVLVIASAARDNPDQKIGRLPTSISLAISAYLFLIFVMAVRRMYSTYLRTFENGQYLRKPSSVTPGRLDDEE